MSWIATTLGNISESIQPGPFGTQLHNSDYSDSGIPIIMPKDMIDGGLAHEGLVFVPDDIAQKLRRHQAHTNNLLVARKGDVKKCILITEQENGWIAGSDCLKVELKEEFCYPKFIYYQLKSDYVGKYMETVSIGATMPSLNTRLLSSIPIMLPAFEIQCRIGDILSAYDDLIKNNQKQIKLLEEAAQRLYKEWFADLRFPGHETTPIVDDIPEGWHEGTIQDVVIYHDKKRKPLSGMQRAEMQGEYRYYGAASILDYVNDYLFDGTYLLLGEDGTVVTEDGFPVLQYVTGKFWVNNHAHVLTGQPGYPTEYLYMMFKSTKVKDVVTGAAQPKISQARLSNKKIIVPSKQLVSAYCDITGPMFKEIINLEHQITVLKEARDRLLPKLMSGEIEV